MEKKWCRTCELWKGLAEFYKHPATADRRLADCKECHKAKVIANRTANVERFRAYDRTRADLPHRVEARAEYGRTRRGMNAHNRASRAWAAKNKDRRAAHHILAHAIESGRIERQSCEVCGNARSHAHHDDYAQPLKVRWLCSEHHRLLHKTER